MHISFRTSDDNTAVEILLDKKFIGTVRLDVWSSTWKLKPAFKYNTYIGYEELNTKYDSSYKAGKALVKVYQDTFRSYDEDVEDTQELDIRDIWKSFKRDP
jgi:hypothetical protein